VGGTVVAFESLSWTYSNVTKTSSSTSFSFTSNSKGSQFNSLVFNNQLGLPTSDPTKAIQVAFTVNNYQWTGDSSSQLIVMYEVSSTDFSFDVGSTAAGQYGPVSVDITPSSNGNTQIVTYDYFGDSLQHTITFGIPSTSSSSAAFLLVNWSLLLLIVSLLANNIL
jgi:hypothetical protein